MLSKFKTFTIIIFIAFISLPIIFPEHNPLQMLQKENTFYDRDTPLPVLSKDNLFKRYVKRLKKFYNLENGSQYQNNTPEENVEMLAKKIKNNSNNSSRNSYNEDAIIDESDLLFSEERTNADSSFIDGFRYNYGNDNYVNIEKGTVLTRDNLLLRPQTDGYYYNNTFFKNGTYPQFANRSYIEGALNRYHTQFANRYGKKAFYSADEKGNLTVNYTDKLPYNNYNLKNFQYKPEENTYVAASKFKDAYSKYHSARISSKQNDIAEMDVATASLYDMHSAYDLLKAQIADRSFTINLSETLSKDISNSSASNSAKDFFKDKENPNIEITDKPNNPATPPTSDEDTLTVVIGNKNFSEDYAYDVHDVGCSTGDMFTRMEVQTYHIAEQMHDNPQISIELGTCKEPLQVTPSANIVSNISQNQELANLRKQIKNIAEQSDKTTINIVSTDRNITPMVRILDEEQTITNNKGEFVKVVSVGPKEDESNLANVMGTITTSLIEEKDKAEELNNTLNEYYLTSNLKPTNTMLAYEAGANDVFVVTDSSNSYWIKNPKEVNTYEQQYLIKDGVYYKGAMIPKQKIVEMTNKDRTNFLLVSNTPSEHLLPNGSVLITVKDEDINMHSFDPQTIMQNTGLITQVTKKGDNALKNMGNNVSNIFKDQKNTKQEIPQNFDPEKKRTFNVALDPNKEEKQTFTQRFRNLIGI